MKKPISLFVARCAVVALCTTLGGVNLARAQAEVAEEFETNGNSDPAPEADDAEVSDADTSQDYQGEDDPEAESDGFNIMDAGVPFGVGVGVHGVNWLFDRVMAIFALASPALYSSLSIPICFVGLGLCLVLPGIQGGAMVGVGQLLGSRQVGWHTYLWTILTSYASCYSLGCLGFLVGTGINMAILGGTAAVNPQELTNPSATTRGATLLTGALVMGLVMLVQPIAPTVVYMMTSDPAAPAQKAKVKKVTSEDFEESDVDTADDTSDDTEALNDTASPETTSPEAASPEANQPGPEQDADDAIYYRYNY